MSSNGRLLVLTTGGTIDKVYADALSAFTIGDSEFPGLVEQVGLSVDYRLEAVMHKDSLDLTDRDRQTLKDRIENAPERRILVTHGTDSMAESARFVGDFRDRVVVFTGAMLPSRMRDTDAVFNIGFALGVLQTLSSGTHVAMNGRLFDPAEVRKNREAGRFEPLASLG